VSVQIGIKAQLFCHPSPSKEATLRIWEITPRDWPSCRLPYRAELQQISKKICTERGTTRVPAHHQSSDLPIKSMALKHDGHYSCRIETTDGIFQERHSIQVPGKPHTVLFRSPDVFLLFIYLFIYTPDFIPHLIHPLTVPHPITSSPTSCLHEDVPTSHPHPTRPLNSLGPPVS
jgi:hypothetical protein